MGCGADRDYSPNERRRVLCAVRSSFFAGYLESAPMTRLRLIIDKEPESFLRKAVLAWVSWALASFVASLAVALGLSHGAAVILLIFLMALPFIWIDRARANQTPIVARPVLASHLLHELYELRERAETFALVRQRQEEMLVHCMREEVEVSPRLRRRRSKRLLARGIIYCLIVVIIIAAAVYVHNHH
jgi:hypothetical protein